MSGPLASRADRMLDLGRRLAPVPWQLLRARVALRTCDRVGAGTRVASRWPMVRNDGTIEIGRRGVINSQFAPVQIITDAAGSIHVGDRHVINFGTALRAASAVRVGSDVTIGPYCVIDDTRLDDGSSAPVTIGDHAWLASRVVVLPGSTIGERSVIAAGTVVDGDVPPAVLYGGSPARILKQLGNS